MSRPRPRLTDAIDVFGQVLQLALTTLLAPVLNVWLRRPAATEPGPGPAPGRPPVPLAALLAGGQREHGHPARRDWRLVFVGAGLYLLAVVTGALWAMLRRVDSALQQMAVGETRPGGGLGFSVPLSNVWAALTSAAQPSVHATRDAWRGYQDQVAASTVLRSPFTITRHLVLLDLWFIAAYALLLTGVVWLLRRANALTGDAERDRRDRMLRGALGVLGLLVLVDLVEDWQLYRSLVYDADLHQPFGVAVGPLMSLVKWPLTAAVLLPVIFVAVVLAARHRELLKALTSVRGVLYAVGALVLLLNLGIGAAQVDDVIRAWDLPRAAAAVLAGAAVCVVTAGVCRHLSGPAMERVAPDTGRSAQGLLLGGAALLVLAGQALRVAGWGWGLTAAGAVLALLWFIGTLFDEPPVWPDGPARRRRWQWAAAVAGLLAGGVLAALLGGGILLGAALGAVAGLTVLAGWATWRAPGSPRHPAADRVEDGVIAAWGDRAGRIAGGIVAAVVVATIARAVALDAYVREDPEAVVHWPVRAAVAMALLGAVVFSYRVRRPRPLHRSLWFLVTVALLAGGLLLVPDAHAVRWPQRIGTVGVVLAGFALGVGLLAVLATAVRKGPVSEYRLVPALRALRFQRFPVLLFLLVWVLIVSLVDAGGYHDVRRDPGGPAAPAPTIGQAWRAYESSVRGADPRPVVLVAAQGGGLRAAVWTALVMECLFGPGPVRTGADCANGSGSPHKPDLAAEVRRPTPVFLASGTSGGSVGLAAWTARRADLLQDGAASTTPLVLEDALRKDFVAADVARLLLGDVPHAFLAWDRDDRAAMLERAWEEPWPAGKGLARGLRETWALTHAGGWHAPVLAFTGVSVEDNCRMLTSAVDFTLPRQVGATVSSRNDRPNDAACRGVGTTEGTAADILPTTNEVIDYLCPGEDIPLSTAAHLSARFPYVSPTGRIERREDCADGAGLVPGPALSYDADGGLFDNSGAGTAADTWRALAPLAAARERTTGSCLVPLFLQIDSSPPSAAVSSVADSRPNEMLAPITATMNQISSRDRYAKAGAAAMFQQATSAGGRAVTVAGATGTPAWFHLALYGQPGPEPPLGWTLARQTIDDMRSQLNATPNAVQMAALRRALDPANLSCAAPAVIP